MKMKQTVATAVAHVAQCSYCIRAHTKAAVRVGAAAEELMKRFRLRPKCGLELLMRAVHSCNILSASRRGGRRVDDNGRPRLLAPFAESMPIDWGRGGQRDNAE